MENNIIDFGKMHGLGNDFMIVRNIQLSKKQIIKLANRHTGVGFDQLLILNDSLDQNSLEVRYNVEVYNADGSKAAFCGNGFRCLIWLINSAKIASEDTKNNNNNSLIKERVTFDTISGEIIGEIIADLPDRAETSICFPMDIKVEEIMISGVEQAFLVNTGNEHVVCIGSEITELKPLRDLVVETLGRDVNVFYIQEHDCDKQGRVTDIKSLCYERGAGETLACGSGAAAISSVYKHLCLASDKLKVHMPGGILTQTFRADEKDECKYKLWQTGEVRFVFEGSIDLDMI